MSNSKKQPVKGKSASGGEIIAAAEKQPASSKKTGFTIPKGYLVLRQLIRSDDQEIIRPGRITGLEWITDVDRLMFLLERKRVIKTEDVQLCHLPGWKGNADRLEAIGILTPVDYLNAIEAGMFEKLTQTILIDKAALNILAERMKNWFETAQTPDHEIIDFSGG